jgi:hypothetical protein
MANQLNRIPVTFEPHELTVIRRLAKSYDCSASQFVASIIRDRLKAIFDAELKEDGGEK